MENNLKKKIIAKKRGRIVSVRADKTIIVSVDVLKSHSKYKKKYKVTKRYKVYDGEGKHKTGEMVEIEPMKPMSKEKRYKVI